jgi:nitrite reductase/ring-hydroxylating ferredoxin subunit
MKKVTTKKDIPVGGSKIVQQGDQEIALFNVEGSFYAMDNKCPHRGGPLGEGSLEGCKVTCPWHGWEFDVTTGALAMDPAQKLKTFKVEEKGDDLYIEP